MNPKIIGFLMVCLMLAAFVSAHGGPGGPKGPGHRPGGPHGPSFFSECKDFDKLVQEKERGKFLCILLILNYFQRRTQRLQENTCLYLTKLLFAGQRLTYARAIVRYILSILRPFFRFSSKRFLTISTKLIYDQLLHNNCNISTMELLWNRILSNIAKSCCLILSLFWVINCVCRVTVLQEEWKILLRTIST